MLAGQVNAALAAGGLSYKPGSIHVRHLLDVVMEDVGCAGIDATRDPAAQGAAGRALLRLPDLAARPARRRAQPRIPHDRWTSCLAAWARRWSTSR